MSGNTKCCCVIAVGSAVSRFSAGDEVFGIARGSFAEYAAAREDKLARKPVNLSFEQAGVVPVSALTALPSSSAARRAAAGREAWTGRCGPWLSRCSCASG